ncbi:MAG: PspC domain-containing protein [Prevotella sp.]
MKKNIQINIFGTIYAIDEDAYQLLDNYLQGMKQYFCKQEGGEEIADDIEHRVAELLWEYKEHGMEAVNISTVKEIINKIGNPADIAGEPQAQQAPQDDGAEEEAEYSEVGNEEPIIDKIKNHISQHRLYRNTHDKVLGGVCSGLAEYVGVGDVVVWRLAFILLSFFSMALSWAFLRDVLHCIIPVTYLIMWIIVPEAKTPEDKLRMKGREVTPESIREQIVSDSESLGQTASPQKPSNGSGCLRFIFAAILVMLLFPLLSAFFGIILAVITAVLTMFGVATGIAAAFPFYGVVNDVLDRSDPAVWLGLAAAIIVVAIPIAAIIRFVRNKDKPLSTASVVSRVVVWLIALAVAIVCGISTAVRLEDKFEDIREKDSTRNGITLSSSREWDELDAMGWSLKRMANLQNRIIHHESGIKGMDSSVLSFRREDATKPMDVRLERKEFLEEGDYVIEVIASVEGHGLCVKVEEEGNPQAVGSVAINDGGKKLGDIPFNEVGKILAIAEPDSAEWDNLQGQCDGCLAYYTSVPFHVKNGNATTIIEIKNAYMKKASVRHIILHKVK